ncbi:uncharacterized protein J3D65DRAFT_112275 [Phyllosticta citribraziliensis]|uniref:Uncharacterized protein n=1 Tax=Phyllosticta citribraziliensis TaxID=989973 RepID=A0ABR1L800_9PEZI
MFWVSDSRVEASVSVGERVRALASGALRAMVANLSPIICGARLAPSHHFSKAAPPTPHRPMVGTARHPDPPHRSSTLGKTHCLVHPPLSGSILAMDPPLVSSPRYRPRGTARQPSDVASRRVGILASHGICSQMAKVKSDFGRFGLCQTGIVLTFLPFYLFNHVFNTSPFVYL